MADPSQAQSVIPAIVTAAGGIVAGFTGAFFVHRYTLKREREEAAESRRRQFRVFLYQWRSEFSRINHNNPEEAWRHYFSKVNDHYGQIAQVRTDFKPFGKFLKLSAHLGDLRYDDVVVKPPPNKRPCDVIADALDELIRYIEPSNDA